MRTWLRTLAIVLLLAVASSAQAQGRDYSQIPMKTVDSGLGFTLSIPEPWVIGTPSGNNKFLAGGGDDDFAVIVSDFGPVATDAAAADALYVESFTENGFVHRASSDVTVAGLAARRHLFSVSSEAGEGHLVVVMLPVRGEVYSILVATPASELARRQATIDAILSSIALEP